MTMRFFVVWSEGHRSCQSKERCIRRTQCLYEKHLTCRAGRPLGGHHACWSVMCPMETLQTLRKRQGCCGEAVCSRYVVGRGVYKGPSSSVLHTVLSKGLSSTHILSKNLPRNLNEQGVGQSCCFEIGSVPDLMSRSLYWSAFPWGQAEQSSVHSGLLWHGTVQTLLVVKPNMLLKCSCMDVILSSAVGVDIISPNWLTLGKMKINYRLLVPMLYIQCSVR